ncbi:hypothetical protein M0654_03550 [Rhizobium sp. NTR19]|uniref:Twin-arginine translocation pathway signal n=1 Tax=Neorhizobium turbinariae TaxID=2937795 RepID=A0ABT0IME9_9HYPH|nr:hypothetical protein [Neorhizobium turbinariae]MCK8779054.1 hypothetical protein [Neorhizobium turbinariae]
MNRRTVLKASIVIAATSHTAVATADIPDPLLDTIRAYQRGLEDFNRLAGGLDNDECSALADITYGPHLDRLTEWNAPATTLEGAMEALRISVSDQGGVYGCEAAERMVLAALGYLEGLK